MIRGITDYFSLNYHMYHFSEKSLKKYQEKNLKKLINYAVKNSSYYQRTLNHSENILKSFSEIPVMNKKIMMDNFDAINTCKLELSSVMDYAVKRELNKEYLGYYNDEFVVGLSSGTSGNKGIYITPSSMTERLPFVFLARSGIPLKLLPFRILFMLRVFSQGFDDINGPLISLKYLSTMETEEKIILEINNNNINILMAPPSLIRMLIPLREKIKIDLKIIVCYAEVLEKEEKQRFKEIFNTDVIEIYQASEGQIGSTCRCGNLHINEDFVFLELYDKNGNIVNEANKVAEKMILTNMINYAQPLIRYEMNDLIVLGEKCECGSSFRVIKKILGRNDDVLFFQNTHGKIQYIFPDLFARWVITSSDNIREFKVLQNDLSSVTVVIDLLKENDKEKKKITEKLFNKISAELKNFSIETSVKIDIQKIYLPENKAKYKRFVVENKKN